MALLDIDDLNVWYQLPNGQELHAVRGISLTVEAGERVGLVGESGCGKTTALMAIMALLPDSASIAGDVRLDGESILAAGEGQARQHRWRDIALVFQGAMNALNPVRTVLAQIVEPMVAHRVAEGKAARVRARELLDLVGIPPSAGDRFPHQFSGGMRQRAMLAMALACGPRVLLADEPTTALDTMVQAQILELLEHLSQELNLAVVMVTHDLPTVSQLCQRAAVMYAGKIIESGTTDQLFHDPWHPYTRLLYAATPDLYDSQEVVSIPGYPPRLDRAISGCAFFPRCDVAFDSCAEVSPLPLNRVGRGVACHRAEKSLR